MFYTNKSHTVFHFKFFTYIWQLIFNNVAMYNTSKKKRFIYYQSDNYITWLGTDTIDSGTISAMSNRVVIH